MEQHVWRWNSATQLWRDTRTFRGPYTGPYMTTVSALGPDAAWVGWSTERVDFWNGRAWVQKRWGPGDGVPRVVARVTAVPWVEGRCWAIVRNTLTGSYTLHLHTNAAGWVVKVKGARTGTAPSAQRCMPAWACAAWPAAAVSRSVCCSAALRVARLVVGGCPRAWLCRCPGVDGQPRAPAGVAGRQCAVPAGL